MAINYCTNPSLEENTDGYEAAGGATVTRETGDANATGDYCLQCDALAGEGWGFGGMFPIPSLAEYTFSFDCWLDSGGNDWLLSLHAYDVDSNYLQTLVLNQPETLTAETQRL